MSETDIKKAIMDYLALLENLGHLYYFRAGSGCIPTPKGYFRTGRKGCPDIVCCLKVVVGSELVGMFVGFEVKKDEKGKQSKEQKETEAMITALGGKYFIVRSVDEVQNIIDDLRRRYR